MAVIDITKFGGVAPSVDPRELGPERAQTAQNLTLRYGDFRPVRGPGSSVASVPSGSASVHRTPSGTWLHSATDADFVNGQINDAAVERVYLTGRSAYPEAWASGSYRRLGVRPPAAAPTVTVNVVDEFTSIEQQTAQNEWVQSIKDSVLAHITTMLLAGGTPTTGALGAVWLTHGAVSPMPTTLSSQIVYAVPLTAGAATNASDQYLLDPLLAGAEITYAGNPYWAVPITWRPYGYDVDEVALATEIKTFTAPPENVTQLVPDAVADQLAGRVANIANPGVDPLLTLINRVNAAQADVATFLTRNLTDSARVYALASLLRTLNATIRAVDSYFAAWESQLAIVLADYVYLVPAAVERVLENRAYVYTYVSDWGEESAPSEASELVELDQNDTVTVTAAAPPGTGSYGPVSLWRLYRSSTTNAGAAYEFVAETPIGTLAYTDSKKQEELGPDVCQTLTWTEPREDMRGLCDGANGIMLGFSSNVLCACEPYTPYAWPREYELSFPHKIVAIASVGQAWVVLTEGDPYLVSGSDSASLSMLKMDRPQACVSKRSVASTAGGVLFASPDGVCLAGPTGVSVLTLGAYSRDDWTAKTPSGSQGAFHEGIYHLWLPTGEKLTLDFADNAMTLSSATAPSAVYTDLLTDVMYAVVAGAVLPQFAGSAVTATWESGIYTFNTLPSFAWARVSGAFGTGSLTVLADGATVLSATVTANAPVRLPAVRGREWSVRWSDNGIATRIVLASTTAELVSRG